MQHAAPGVFISNSVVLSQRVLRDCVLHPGNAEPTRNDICFDSHARYLSHAAGPCNVAIIHMPYHRYPIDTPHDRLCLSRRPQEYGII